MPLVSLDKVNFGSPDRKIFNAINFKISRGERVALVGPNQSGKSCLFKMLQGDLKPDSGQVSFKAGLKIGYLPQTPLIENELTLWETILAGFKELAALRREIGHLEQSTEEGETSGTCALAEMKERYQKQGGLDLERRAQIALTSLGFDQAQFTQPTNLLSAGEQSRLFLARLLVLTPELLLLDEPTHQLDLPGIEFLEQYLASYPGAAIVATHDRHFIDRFATSIVAIEPKGTLASYPGTYQQYVDISLKKQDSCSHDPSEEFSFPKQEHSGKVVFTVKDLNIQPGGQALLERVSFRVHQGERIGIVGLNNAGKSDLLAVLAGRQTPCSGKVQLGFNAKIGYFNQALLGLTMGRTVLQELAWRRDDLSQKELQLAAERFLFWGDSVERKVESLSSGEQARLALALLILGKTNVLLLDEPTNQLDLASCNVIEQALLAYPGTLLAVSHDRFFLDRVMGRIFSIEGRNLVDETGLYTKLRSTRKIMVDVPQQYPSLHSKNKNVHEEPKQKSVLSLDQKAKRVQELKLLIAQQEKEIECFMNEMADPKRALDWEGLERLQADKQSLEKKKIANQAELKELNG